MEMYAINFQTPIVYLNDRGLLRMIKANRFHYVDPLIYQANCFYEKSSFQSGLLDFKGRRNLSDILKYQNKKNGDIFANIFDLILFYEQEPELQGRKVVFAFGEPYLNINDSLFFPFLLKEGKKMSLCLDNTGESSFSGYYHNISILLKRVD